MSKFLYVENTLISPLLLNYNFAGPRILGCRDFPLEHWCSYPFPFSLCHGGWEAYYQAVCCSFLGNHLFLSLDFKIFFFFFLMFSSFTTMFLHFLISGKFCYLFEKRLCYPSHFIPEFLLKLFFIPSLLSLWLYSRRFFTSVF